MSTIDYSFLGVEGLTGERAIRVWKRAKGKVVYSLDDPKVYRVWNRNDEVKMITFHELYTLSNAPGGRGILQYFLLIKDQEVLQALDLPLDPEYQYTEEDCRKLILKGTKDQILDALEFGGYGVATLIKKAATEVKIDSTSRKKMINGIFGFDLDLIYDNQKAINSGNGNKETTRKRRAEAITAGEEDKKEVAKKKTRSRKSTPLEPTAPSENIISE